MLEKPNLSDDQIISALQHSYALVITSLDFLPIGNDASAWVYRVDTDAQAYFLKVKKGLVYQPSLLVPHHLKAQGVNQVVAPLPTVTGDLSAALDPFRLILYPFIHGESAMERGLSLDQWTTFGTILKQIHATTLPDELLVQMQHEKFALNPQWLRVIQQLQDTVQTTVFDDRFAWELAAFWKDKHAEIGAIVDRAKALGRSLQHKPLDIMLCHADIHTANILVDKAGQLFIVDWDQPVIAPKERDLMFVVEGTVEEETAFFQGYGETEIDPLTLAYYRYEWVVQEFGDYGERVFFMDDVGDETKRDSVRGFYQLFDPGDVVEVAYRADADLPAFLRPI
jgi:spectinomycin phosphotransferase